MAENTKISDDEILSAFKSEQAAASEPVYSKEEAKGISDEALLSAFRGNAPEMQTSGGTLSGGGGLFQPEMIGSTAPAEQSALVVSGPLGSGKFSNIPVGPKGKFDEYAGIADPDTRKGIAETVFKNITDPKDLKELQEKVPWYDMSENPTQVKSLFLHEWSEKTDPFELVGSAAKAGVGMLQSLPPLVAGAGRLAKDIVGGLTYDWDGDPSGLTQAKVLTEQQRKGLSEQQIRDAELSAPDKLIRASRVAGDAILEAEEQLRTAVANFAENKSMLWDKAKVGFAGAPDYGDFSGLTATPETEQESQARRAAKTAELMEEAEKNFAARLNAKHVEYLHREKNPAVLARDIEAVWKYPAVKTFAANVIENLMPSAEDIQSYLNSGVPGFGGDFAPVFASTVAGDIDAQTAKALRRAQAVEAAEVGVQAAIAESNRLQEDPEQVGAIAMTTPANVVGLMGKIAQQAGKLTRGVNRGMQAAFYTEQELNALYSAERAAERAAAEAQARVLEQPGWLEQALGSTADTFDKAKAAFAKVPVPAQYIGMAGLGGLAGAVTADDPLTGFLEGAGTGAAGRLGMKLGGGALLAAPRLGQELSKAGRLAGAEMGRFETLERLGSASPEVQRFANWSQKVGGSNVMDFIEKNASVFVQHNVSMLPMMVALGVLEDKDAKEFAQMWAEFATYGFIHGQVLGGILGNDPVRMRMDREANMRQAQRVVNSLSPESRENVNLTWDRVVEQSEATVRRTRTAYWHEMAADPGSRETAEAKSDYEFAIELHRQNLIAPPEARAAFEDGIKLSLAQASNLLNGVLTPNSNMNIELLTTEQIIQKMISLNPNYNGVGAPMTREQALEKNPGADGAKIGKGFDQKGFMLDAAKDTVFVNIDNALAKGRLSGQALSHVIAHEIVGHGLFGKLEYKQKIAPLFNKMFGTEMLDENGNWIQITPAQPGLSREDLLKKFFEKYLENQNPEEVAKYAEAAGVWDTANNTFNNSKIVELMREEVLAEAHAGRFFGDPESPLQRGIGWLATRITGDNLRAALNHLYSIAGPAVYNQWVSGATGATYSPEVMRAIRNVERQMKQYDGEFTDAEAGEGVDAPITEKDVKKSGELLQKYFGDTGKFETKPVVIVTDAEGNVLQSVPLADNEAFEGSWNFQQDEATGANVPNRESGFGDIPPEMAGIEVPVGGRLQVQRQIAYDESTGKPRERKNKETVEYLKRRLQLLREAIDNAGDPSEIGRFKAIPSKSEDADEEGDMRYTGKLTPEQRKAIAELPESIVPSSMKELLFKYDDLITRGDGTVLDIDYAARLNAKGNYEAFSPRIRQIVPLRLHLSKDGNFYVKAWDLSSLRRKVDLYRKYAKGVFEPWGGDVDAFWKEFRTKLLPKLAEKPDIEKIRQDISEEFPDLSQDEIERKVSDVYTAKLNEPAWTALDPNPEVAKLKRTIYAKMLGDPNPNIPDVESIPDFPRDKLSRSERKLDKKSSLDKTIKSYRLDAHTAAEENANSDFKYPIPYKARFLPEQEAAGTGAQMRFQPEKLNSEYEAAFEAKDEQKAQKIVNQLAKAAGYDTSGWYHGQNSPEKFNEFNPEKGNSFGRFNAFGSWFAKDKIQAEGYSKYFDKESNALKTGNVYNAHLKIDRPLVLESFDGLTEAFKQKTGKEPYNATKEDAAVFRNSLIEAGYDSVLLPEVDKDSNKGADEIQSYAIVLSPSQVKSSNPFTYDNEGKLIPLLERFNAGTGDIRFMPGTAELPVSKFEDEYRRVPSQEELDAMKAKLPKYSATVDVSGNRDNLYLIKLFDESDNQIGYAHASRNPKDPTSGLEVESVHLEGDYRGKGYGQALYREIAKLAQGLGISKLTSSTTSRLAANARSNILETNWRGAGWNAESNVPSDIRFMPNVAVVPERFTGTGEEEQRRGRYVEPPKFFKRFDISQYELGGKFFDAETGEDLTNKTYENASIAVVDGKPTLVANNEAEGTGTGPLVRTNLFKQKAGWKWVSEGAPDTSTIVSVEGQGKHLYALQADFQNGVTMARYPDKASEPRLRPTGRGELAMGEQIGTIDIRGKQHPVYDKVTIGQAVESELQKPNRGININDGGEDFTGMILNGEKTVETRDQNKSLAPYVGKRVGIISTGKGPAILVGYADVGEPVEYRTPEEFRAAQEQHQVPEGSSFDIKPGQSKFGFPLSNVERLPEPKRVPVSGRVASDLSGIRFMPERLDLEQPAVDEQTQQTRINEPGRKAEDIGVRPDEARNRGGQRTSRGYSPLAGAPNVYGRSGPIERISDIADRYADSRGIAVRKQAAYVEADVERGKRIAEEYAKMPHDPQNPRVQEAYADLIRQSGDQYKALVEDGYKAWFIDPANDPYEGKPWKAMRDLRENESMGVFPTESGFGSGDTELVVSDNPLLGDSGLKWPYGSPDGPLRRVLWNDVFRYIHDAFGHGIEGAGFREDGEENAWQAHVRLFDGPAVGAMTSETRGQNSWLNFGPHAEKNKTASVEETIFADQKTGLMPEWTWNEGVAPDEPLLERGTLSDIRFMPAAKKKKPAKQKKGAAEEEKLSPQEKAAIKLKTAFVVDEGDSVSLPILQETANGKPKLDKNKEPKIIKLDYNLVDSPEITQFSGGVVEDPSKPDWESLAYDVPAKFQKVINAAIDSGAIDDAANRAVEKTARYLRNPEIAAGKGWYSRMRENLLAALGEEKRELLSQLLGATSAKTPVNENFLQAMDGLEGIMSGRYDSNRKSYLAMLAAEEKGELNTLINEKKYVATIESKIKQLKKEAKKLTGKKQQTAKTEISKLEELIAIPEEERTKRDRMKITVLGSGLMPLRSNGKKFNANSMAVMKVIAGTWLDNRKAPKTPNFAGNLSGRTVQATIDVWAARFLRQLLYENSGQPWRIQPKSEEGVSNEDFALGQVIMERVAKKLDMNPDDLQAVLWFAEKDNWEKQGWTKSIGAEKSSFDEIFHKFFPKDRKPLSFQEAIELFAKEKAKINEAETEEVEDGEEEDIE